MDTKWALLKKILVKKIPRKPGVHGNQSFFIKVYRVFFKNRVYLKPISTFIFKTNLITCSTMNRILFFKQYLSVWNFNINQTNQTYRILSHCWIAHKWRPHQTLNSSQCRPIPTQPLQSAVEQQVEYGVWLSVESCGQYQWSGGHWSCWELQRSATEFLQCHFYGL